MLSVQVIKTQSKHCPPQGGLNQLGKKHKVNLESLVYGDDYKDLILQIEHIESEKLLFHVRNIAEESQSRFDLNEKLLSPTHNVYSATGTEKRL